jgi:hypothetical protein
VQEPLPRMLQKFLTAYGIGEPGSPGRRRRSIVQRSLFTFYFVVVILGEIASITQIVSLWCGAPTSPTGTLIRSARGT